jgi:hypothetical protein
VSAIPDSEDHTSMVNLIFEGEFDLGGVKRRKEGPLSMILRTKRSVERARLKPTAP